jgi:hypothetical protein
MGARLRGCCGELRGSAAEFAASDDLVYLVFYALGNQRFFAPVEGLVKEFPGWDAEVSGRADGWIPVRYPTQRAAFEDVAPQGCRFLQAVGANASPA